MQNGQTPADKQPEKGNHAFTKRIPIPYHATGCIDAALMELSDLTRAANRLVSGAEKNPGTALALIIDYAHKATNSLQEIKRPQNGAAMDEQEIVMGKPITLPPLTTEQEAKLKRFFETTGEFMNADIKVSTRTIMVVEPPDDRPDVKVVVQKVIASLKA